MVTWRTGGRNTAEGDVRTGISRDRPIAALWAEDRKVPVNLAAEAPI